MDRKDNKIIEFSLLPDAHPSDEEGMKKQQDFFEKLRNGEYKMPYIMGGDQTTK